MKKGFIPVMLTPFKDNGAIDYSGLTILTERYLNAGVTGLFANCLSSEMFDLDSEERQKVVRHVVDVVGGAVPVVASGTFGGDISEQADFVKRIYDCGVHAVIALTNMLANVDESDTVLADRTYQLFEKTGDIPIGMYECPVPYKRVISPKQLGEFAATGKLIYHKDTCLDILQIKAKLASTVESPRFGLYDAYMVHAVDSLRAGSAGLSCIQGNFWPELIVWICDNYDNPGKAAELEGVMNFLIENMHVMHHVYPLTTKYYWNKRNLPISVFTRQQVGVLSGEVKENIDELHNNYTRLVGELDLPFAR